jgi:hypothetical protein
MLTIAEQRYMLLADEVESGYSGQLHNLVSGEMISVELTLNKDKLEIRFKGLSAKMIELEKSDR